MMGQGSSLLLSTPLAFIKEHMKIFYPKALFSTAKLDITPTQQVRLDLAIKDVLQDCKRHFSDPAMGWDLLTNYMLDEIIIRTFGGRVSEMLYKELSKKYTIFFRDKEVYVGKKENESNTKLQSSRGKRRVPSSSKRTKSKSNSRRVRK